MVRVCCPENNRAQRSHWWDVDCNGKADACILYMQLRRLNNDPYKNDSKMFFSNSKMLTHITEEANETHIDNWTKEPTRHNTIDILQPLTNGPMEPLTPTRGFGVLRPPLLSVFGGRRPPRFRGGPLAGWSLGPGCSFFFPRVIRLYGSADVVL